MWVPSPLSACLEVDLIAQVPDFYITWKEPLYVTADTITITNVIIIIIIIIIIIVSINIIILLSSL